MLKKMPKLSITLLECYFFGNLQRQNLLILSETAVYGLALCILFLKIENSLLINYKKTQHSEIDDSIVI